MALKLNFLRDLFLERRAKVDYFFFKTKSFSRTSKAEQKTKTEHSSNNGKN